MSYALRHLGIAEHTAGQLDAARDRLEESVRLRREIGFLPGVAANRAGCGRAAADRGSGVDGGVEVVFRSCVVRCGRGARCTSELQRSMRKGGWRPLNTGK
jgi:hypothetical protein